MKLAERREVVEKSGLCTFCLRHGAELECYAKGGLSKPKCARLGCDGEHVTGLHALLGEADTAVNLVAGSDGETIDDHEGEHGYQYGWDCGGSWAGTVEAAEVPEEADEPADGPGGRDTAPCTDTIRERDEEDQWGYESLWVGTIGAMEVSREMDRITSATACQGPIQEDNQVRAREETTEDEDEQWDLDADWSSGGTNAPRDPGQESPHRPAAARRGRPARRDPVSQYSDRDRRQLWISSGRKPGAMPGSGSY
jgi:hypothetical protein